MKAIILAAGRGKRLKPLTDSLPKTLVKVNGRTILERLVDNLTDCGIKDIIIVSGYLAPKVNKVMERYPNVSIIFNKDYDKTDNMYSLYLCREKCAGEDVIIMNGDLIVNKGILMNSINLPFSNMPIEMDPSIKDGQRVSIIENRIRSISKKLENAQGIAINIIRLSKEDMITYFNNIEKIVNEKRLNEWWEVALNETLHQIIVKPIETSGFWIEIDDMDDFRTANDMLVKLEGAK